MCRGFISCRWKFNELAQEERDFTMIISRSINQAIRNGKPVSELWNKEDKGIIHAWESGRKEAQKKSSELSRKAKNGELPVLVFRGGFKERLENPFKYGSLHYYAMWLGLRGEDLHLNIVDEPSLVCSRTKICVKFTIKSKKYLLLDIGVEDKNTITKEELLQVHFGPFFKLPGKMTRTETVE